MRVIKASLFLFALHVLCACSLDFDQFGQAKTGDPHDMDGGSDDGGGIALPGDPCTDENSRACAGHDSRNTLICQHGKWQPGAECDDGERCDSRDGADQGHCVKIPTECKDKQASEQFCAGNTLRTCNIDRVAFDDVACGAFGTCTAGSGDAQCTCDSGHALASNGSCATSTGDAGMDGGGGGSGGNGGTGGTGPKNDAPVVSVVFPLPGVTDHTSITVRGTVSDPEDDKITKLTVNGAAATVKNGKFSVSAPLAIGKHELALHVEDDGGGKGDSNGPEIERLAYMFELASDMVLDSANDRVIALDGTTDAIVAISLDDGARKVIVPPSDTPVGRSSIDLDAAHHRLLATEQNPAALVWIDINTGKRTLISDASKSGPAMMPPHTAVLDPVDTARVFVTAPGNDDGFNSDVVLAVDLANGNRTKISNGGVNNISAVQDLAYDQARNQLLMLQYGAGLMRMSLSTGAIVSIATATHVPQAGYGAVLFNPMRMSLDGDRVVVFGSEGSGLNCVYEIDLASGRVHEVAALALGKDAKPPTRNGSGMPGVFDPDSGDAIALDPTGTLLRARLSPGDREFVSDALFGSGPLLSKPIAIAEDASRNRWIVADEELNAIFGVDKATGNRTLISDGEDGNMPTFEGVVALDMDAVSDDIIVLDYQSLFRVDPVSGARSIIASEVTGALVGSGVSFAGAVDLVVQNETRAFVVGCYGNFPCGGQMIAIDLATGNRTLFSGSGTGSGPTDGFTGITLHNGNYLVSGNTMLLSVDGTTGDRTVLSDASTGDGPALKDIQALTLDTHEDRAIVINEFDTPQKFVAIDLVNGDRTLLTDPTDDALGPYPGILADVIADAASHRLVVAEGWRGNEAGLLGVLLADQKRTLISQQDRGDWMPYSMMADPDTGTLYGGLVDPAGAADSGSIVALDTRTSDRSVIAKTGAQVTWKLPLGLSVDADGNRLLASNGDIGGMGQLIAIDLKTKKPTVLADAATGTGLPWNTALDTAWDAEHERILVAAPGLPAIVAIDKDGDRTAFSGGTGGGGTPAINLPWQMALDPQGERLLIVDGTQIYAAALADGTRSPFTGGGAGSGPDLVKPSRAVLDSVHDRLVVLDFGNDTVEPALIAVALDDGARSVIAPLPRRWYNQSLFIIPPPMAYDESTEIAFVGRLIALDTQSGDYVLIAGTGN